MFLKQGLKQQNPCKLKESIIKIVIALLIQFIYAALTKNKCLQTFSLGCRLEEMRFISNDWDWPNFLKQQVCVVPSECGLGHQPPSSPEDCWFVAVSIRGSSRDNHLVRYMEGQGWAKYFPSPKAQDLRSVPPLLMVPGSKPAAHPLWLWDGADPAHHNRFLGKLAEECLQSSNVSDAHPVHHSRGTMNKRLAWSLLLRT